MASDAAQVTIVEDEFRTAPFAGAVMETNGTTVSTITSALVVTAFPAQSTVSRRTVCKPSERPVKVYPVLVAGRAVTGPPSKLTSKWLMPEVASAAVHVIVKWEKATTAPAIGDVMATLGGVVSTMTDTETVVECPARSKAVTAKVWLPSARLAKV